MKHIGHKVKVCRGGSNFVTMGNQIIFRSLAILVGLEIIDFRKSHSGLLSRYTPLHFLASWNKLKLLQQFIVSHLLTAVSSGTSVRRSRPVSWQSAGKALDSLLIPLLCLDRGGPALTLSKSLFCNSSQVDS